MESTRIISIAFPNTAAQGSIDVIDYPKPENCSDIEAINAMYEAGNLVIRPVEYNHDVLASYRLKYQNQLPTVLPGSKHVIYMAVDGIPGRSEKSLVAFGLAVNAETWYKMDKPSQIKHLYASLCAIH